MKIAFVAILIIVVVILLVWIGLKVNPQSFQASLPQSQEFETIPLSDGLPAPVAHFYRQIYGEAVPVIDSAVITGSAKLRLPSKGGITFPGRFRFIHNAGKDYRHYIEATIYGIPIMTVNEYFLDGKSRLELPFGVSEGAKVDQGANLALWAEAIWFPSIWITDPGVYWESIDEDSANLVVPFGEEEERFLVGFDPETGMLTQLESMRFKETNSNEKTKWLIEAMGFKTINDYLIPSVGAVTWGDEESPWATFVVENIVYNVDIHRYLKSEEP